MISLIIPIILPYQVIFTTENNHHYLSSDVFIVEGFLTPPIPSSNNAPPFTKFFAVHPWPILSASRIFTSCCVPPTSRF